MKKYDHKKIEKKWQKYWGDNGTYKTKEGSDKPKYYVLDMFPYPSGAGLHVGHPKGYIATDIVARMKMMQGYNVLHPMGWDAFGLPAENYAIKNKVHPAVATAENIETFKKQLGLLGFTYDWDREVNTTDPKYYKWTQWAFIEMFKRGLAFESYEPINWCPECKTGLANEDLDNGLCERCGSQVEQKPMRQWVLKITDYAERMLKDLDQLKGWPESIKLMQKEWIGKSEGALLKFDIKGTEDKLEVFTTRPDTLFGATYCVMAPEHELVKKLSEKIKNWDSVEEYISNARKKTSLERTELQKDKTGVELKGIKAINPVNKEELPIFIADYVLTGYGTGAIMAVPAHDERDFEFARKYDLPIREVVAPLTVRTEGPDAVKDGVPFKERNAVVCVVKHWSEDKYMGIRWNNTYWQGFVIGGVESGEEPSATGAREITEETGYKNVEFVGFVGGTVHAQFYQAAKQENRFAHFVPLLFKLKDGEQAEIEEKEKALHEIKWLTSEEMDSFVTHEDMKIIWRRVRGNELYSGVGILENSGQFSGTNSEEAKKVITEFAGGKLTTNYKLRDWVFSRQRYWGEPIPLVHCEKCKNKKLKILLIHGVCGHSKENWFPWFKEEMESKGFDVLIPDMVNAEHPTLEEWTDQLSKLGLTKEDKLYVIGHSLGAPAACQFILKNNLAVEKLILVAPTGVSQGEANWDNLSKAGCKEESIESIRSFNKQNFDLDKLKNLASERVVYLSDNDPYIPMNVEGDYSALEATVKVFKNKGHFSAGSGVNELPEITEEFSRNVNSGWVPVPESELPLELPKVKNYEPSGTGESPLVNITDWVNTKCPTCGGPAKRETNTMPQWAGSCWYYLRYIDPNNSNALVDKEKEKYWSPIDLYVGGAEHATRHLIYARFWHKFLYDIGVVSYPEPFTRLQNVGLILAADGRKMSKRWGNVINPNEVVEEYGADSMRLYEMFMGPFDQPCAWNMQGLVGMKRFLEKVWSLQEKINEREPDSKLVIALHQTIKKITEDVEAMRFNTAIAQLMTFVNELSKADSVNKEMYLTLIKLVSPFAPHLSDELFEQFNGKGTVFESAWPKFDVALTKDETITLAVQINGKLRDTLEVAADISEDEAKKVALESEKVQKWLEGKEPKKVIYVKGKLVSIVL